MSDTAADGVAGSAAHGEPTRGGRMADPDANGEAPPAAAAEPRLAPPTHAGRFLPSRRRAQTALAGIRDQRGYRMRRLLAVADAIGITGAVGIALGLDPISPFGIAPDSSALLVVIAIPLWLVIGAMLGVFHVDDRRIDCATADEMGRLAQATAVWTWAVFLVESLRLPGAQPVGPAIVLWAFSVPCMLVMRDLLRRWARGREWYRQPTLIVGTATDTWRVRTMLVRHPEYGISVADTAEMPAPGDPGASKRLAQAVGTAGAARVIFASPYGSDLDERTGALRDLTEAGIKVDLIPSDSEVFRSDAEVHFAEGIPFLTLPSTYRPRSAALIKRVMDIGLAAAALVVLSPLFAWWAARIKLDSRGPVFFRQRRTGLRGRSFYVFKFRTMCADAEHRLEEVADLRAGDAVMFKLPNDPRVTRYGATLRRNSIDELPQLINVLRGEMSLVGPRPLPVAESDQVPERYRARFRVRPGVTGPWQVLGRSAIPFEDMLKLDYTYVTNWSIGDDVKLLVRTLGAIGHGRGAY
jgi:exopolysaccharide biosynthesis polyprenyl glycosylphosphotransferase